MCVRSVSHVVADVLILAINLVGLLFRIHVVLAGGCKSSQVLATWSPVFHRCVRPMCLGDLLLMMFKPVFLLLKG